jgi:hypothetical protein
MEVILFLIGVLLILFGGITLIVWCLINIDPNPLILCPIFAILIGSLIMAYVLEEVGDPIVKDPVTEPICQEIVIDNKRYVLAEDIIIIDGKTYVPTEDMNEIEVE